MKFHLGLLVIGLCFSYTQAQAQTPAPPVRDIRQLAANAQALRADVRAEQEKIAKNAAEIQRLEDAIRTAQQNYDANSEIAEVRKAGAGTTWYGGAITEQRDLTDPKYIKALTDAKAQQGRIDELKKANNELAKKAGDLEAQRVQASTAFETLSAQAQSQLNTVGWTLSTLSNDINRSKLDLIESQVVLNKVREAHDNKVLGVYMRSKMAQLLNSKAFCAAKDACASGQKNPAAVEEMLRGELFSTQSFGKGSVSRPTNTQGTK